MKARDELASRKSAFRRLQIIHGLSLVGILAAILLFGTNAYHDESFWTVRNIGSLLLAAVSMICAVRFWRCPACGHSLENKWPKKECPFCRKVLR